VSKKKALPKKEKKAKKTEKLNTSADVALSPVVAAETTTGTEPSAHFTGPGKGVWQYLDGNWRDYATDASDIVEGVFQEFLANPGMGLDVRSVKSGHWTYTVDFQSNEQRNTNTGTVRKIRRRAA